MQLVRTKSALESIVTKLKQNGKIIGFVPTMGALHDGHLSLMAIAKSQADILVVSIFVNPAQFAPNEDFSKYPRQVEADLAKLKAAAVDIAYLPSVEEIYPQNFSTSINIGNIGDILEGQFRPGFFAGVALVVTKLFMQVAPDIAVFGEKDYQQLIIVTKLVHDLDIKVKIIPAAIMREPSGLAMSSRNIYLAEDKRSIAANLYKTLVVVREKLLNGGLVPNILSWAENNLLQTGFEQVDYIKLCAAETLLPLDKLQQPARVLAVARLSGVRILDNLQV